MSQKVIKIADHIALFGQKCEMILNSEFDTELDTWSFFDEVFWRGDKKHFEVEQSREYQEWKEGREYRDEQPFVYNALAVELVKKKDGEGMKQGRRWVIYEGEHTDPIAQLQDGEFVITSPITYIGRSRTAKNARYAYGYAIDLDGVGMGQLRDLLHQMRIGYLPMANIIVNSGTGVHVYYLFEKPIALFDNMAKVLQQQKNGLITLIWNWATSSLKDPQRLGIYQGFRVPGTPTKLGKDIKVRAFYNRDQGYWSVGEFNRFFKDPKNILEQWQIDLIDKAVFKEDRLTRKQAKALYPEWSERVIERGDKTKRSWKAHRGLYEWWKNVLRTEGEAKVGHRFLCLVALAMYAKKCGVSYEELEEDMLSFVEPFEELTYDDDNHFTTDDAYDALKSFKEDYCYISRSAIEHITNIRIDKNKRSYRRRDLHLKMARAVRDISVLDKGKERWDIGNGRPKGSVVTAEDSPQAKMIRDWRDRNPDSKNKSLCARETGLSRPTVRKWWDC